MENNAVQDTYRDLVKREYMDIAVRSLSKHKRSSRKSSVLLTQKKFVTDMFVQIGSDLEHALVEVLHLLEEFYNIKLMLRDEELLFVEVNEKTIDDISVNYVKTKVINTLAKNNLFIYEYHIEDGTLILNATDCNIYELLYINRENIDDEELNNEELNNEIKSELTEIAVVNGGIQ